MPEGDLADLEAMGRRLATTQNAWPTGSVHGCAKTLFHVRVSRLSTYFEVQSHFIIILKRFTLEYRALESSQSEISRSTSKLRAASGESVHKLIFAKIREVALEPRCGL